MHQFRVIGGDPAAEFRRLAEASTEREAIVAARSYLEQAGAGAIAAVVPGDRLFANQGGNVREIGGAP